MARRRLHLMPFTVAPPPPLAINAADEGPSLVPVIEIDDVTGQIYVGGVPVSAGGGGGGWTNLNGSHSLYVDGSRTDSYTQTGSVNQPFKTIQAAINQMTTNGDCSPGTPYVIVVRPGTYVENLDFSCPGTASVNVFLTALIDQGPTTSDAVVLGTLGQTTITMAANANRIGFMGFHTMGNIIANGTVSLSFTGCYLGNGTSITANGNGSVLCYDTAIWSNVISILAGNMLVYHSDLKVAVTWTFASGTALSVYEGSQFLGPITVPNGVSINFNAARVYSTSDITVGSGGTLNFNNSQSLSNLIVQAGGTANVQDSSFISITNSGTLSLTGMLGIGGIVLGAAAPTVSAGQLGLGAGKTATASAGAGSAPPANVDSYWIVNDGGVQKKIALFL